MIRVMLCEQKLICYDKTVKEFRIKYGVQYEQVSVIKDAHNLEHVIDRLADQYKALSIVYDCHIKKKFGWKYWSDDQKERLRALWSKQRAGRKMSDFQKAQISKALKGRSNHTGKKHRQDTKENLALRALGHTRNRGRRWCYDPDTKVERFVLGDIPDGYVLGRNPDLECAKNFNSY